MPLSSNPFSTKYWTPGVFAYAFEEPEMNIGALIEAFVRSRSGIVQIVGPHGSGKTTLIESMCSELEHRGVAVRRATLHDRERTIPAGFMPGAEDSRTVFFLDGYEQLSPFSRFQLRMQPWRSGTAGLVFTTHRSARRIPVLYRTVSRFDRFREIVDRLTGTPTVDETKLKEIFERSAGNFRTAFFELYDLRAETTGTKRCRP